MKIKVLMISLLIVVGCGSPETKVHSYQRIGTDGIESYLVARNMTGEDFQNFQNNTANKVDTGYVRNKEKVKAVVVNTVEYVGSLSSKVGASKNKASEYLVDRNLAGDAFHTQAKDYQAKVTRKGEIAKGYVSDRLDQIKDPDRKERDDIRDLQNKVEDMEADAEAYKAEQEKLAKEQSDRADLIESVNELQYVMLELQKSRLDALETDVASLDLVVTSNKEEQDVMNGIQSTVNSIFSNSLDSLTTDLSELQGRMTNAEGNIASQGVLIVGLTIKTERIKQELLRLKSSMRRLKGKVSNIKSKLRDLKRALYRYSVNITELQQSVAANEQNITDLQNDTDLVCSVSTSQVLVTNRGFDGSCGHSYYSSCKRSDFDSRVFISIPTVTCPQNNQ